MDIYEFKKKRKEAGLTQKELAFKIGIDQSTISKWEMGKHPIPEWVNKLIELMQLIKKGQDRNERHLILRLDR
jgi:transcriptional regulator with XRE-family HTH domain